MKHSLQKPIRVLRPSSTSTLNVNTRQRVKNQSGYALLAIVSFLMIIGAVATGGITLTTKTERLAGNAIQRSRSFQAADGAAVIAESKLQEMMQKRIFADRTASRGIFTRDMRSTQWWRTAASSPLPNTSAGVHVVDSGLILGVVAPPRYVIEEVGSYLSDGGTGVVNLDIGGSAYGRLTSGGREFLLFSVESHGKGSFETVETVIESTIVFSY